MTWGSTVLNANTPYESFHHRHRRTVNPEAALPLWSSRSSRDMMKSSLELNERAQTARSRSRRRGQPEGPRAGTASHSARRPRIAASPRAARNLGLAMSQSRSLGLHFPLVVTPPPTPPPRTPPAVFIGGSGFSRLLSMKLKTPRNDSSRRLGYTDLDWLLSLTSFEELMTVRDFSHTFLTHFSHSSSQFSHSRPRTKGLRESPPLPERAATVWVRV